MAFSLIRRIVRDWRDLTVTTALSWLMKALMLGLVPIELYRGNYLFSLAILLAVAIAFVPSIFEKNYNVTLPFELELLITVSIFLHTFFGEGLDFYRKFWLFDKALHFYGGAVVGFVSFVVVYNFHFTGRLKLSLPLVWFFTVVFTMGAGAMWEICEFVVDQLFAKGTQDGLIDTMWDLINDFFGGMISAVLGVLYVKYARPENRKRLLKPLGQALAPMEHRRKRRPRGRTNGQDVTKDGDS